MNILIESEKKKGKKEKYGTLFDEIVSGISQEIFNLSNHDL